MVDYYVLIMLPAYTRCYQEPGGMQVERTKKRIHDSAVYLTEKYPLIMYIKHK